MQPQDVVYDVEPGQFEGQVIRASASRPVVVDFWAEWCAPCRSLTPVLEAVVRSYGGRAALAKVNVDQHQQAAVQYSVRGIPAVKVFFRGEIVSEFVGALPRAEVERILARAIPSHADEMVAEADELLAKRDMRAAEQRLRSALEEKPAHSGALLRLGLLALEKGDAAEAQNLLGKIEADAPEHESAQAGLARIEFAETCQAQGGAQDCRRRAEEEPDNAEAHYNLGCCYAAGGDYGPALDEFLRVLTLERDFKDQAARRAMLSVFSLAGPQGDLARTYRKKLARLLY
ncbi:MAG: tetratricopeptide repeat protein [Planctomycetes bacterium]|nr:tetratricopeptide repeat protein [Planctomycetota bacterium]